MPKLNSFSRLSERSARALPARNLINEWEIRGLCSAACNERLRYLDDLEKQAIESWAMGTARKHFIRSLPVEKVSASFDGAPEWVDKALLAGQTVERALITGEARAELGHVLDWLVANPQRQLSKLSWEQAAKKTKAWDASLQKARSLQEDPTGIEGFCEAASMGFGWRWVEVKSKASLEREGAVMRHCVGSYAPQVEQGKCRIFSLRDANNKPKLTVEVARQESLQELLQIRGSSNRPPEPEEGPALRELIKKLTADGARLSGGRELSSSGGLWDEASQEFLLLSELPAGGSYPASDVSLGRRSGRLADNLTFREVKIKAAPEDGLPKGLKAERVIIAGSGSYDLRGWAGAEARVESKEPVRSVWIDGFERVKWVGQFKHGYGVIRHGELRVQNACKAEIADERFERMEVDSIECGMARVSARSANWRARPSKAEGEPASIRLFDCSFEELVASSEGLKTQALFESVSAERLRVEGEQAQVVHLGGEYESAEASPGVRQLALKTRGAMSSDGMDSDESARLKALLREGVVEITNEAERQARKMIAGVSQVEAEGVLRMLSSTRFAMGDRFCEELGQGCPAPIMGEGSGWGAVIDYELFSGMAEALASEATKTAREAQRLSLKPLEDLPEQTRSRLSGAEPSEQLYVFAPHLGEAFAPISVSKMLEPMLAIPEGLRALGLKNHRYVDERGEEREMPLYGMAMPVLAGLRETDEGGKPLADQGDLGSRYYYLINPAGDSLPETDIALSQENLEEAKEWMARCSLASYAQSEGDIRDFAQALASESAWRSNELIAGGGALMKAMTVKDPRNAVEPARALIEIKTELARAVSVFHHLGQAGEAPGLAREALEQWMTDCSKQRDALFVKDPQALKEAAGVLLPDACFGARAAKTLMKGALVSVAKGRLPEWGIEALQEFCRAPSALEKVALARALEKSASAAKPGPLKSLLEAVASKALAAEQSAEEIGAPEGLRELEEALYETPLLAWEWARREGRAAAPVFAHALKELSAEAAEREAASGQGELGGACARAALYGACSAEAARVYFTSLTQTALEEGLIEELAFDTPGQGRAARMDSESRKKILRWISCSNEFTVNSRANLINAAVECQVERPAPLAGPGAAAAGPRA